MSSDDKKDKTFKNFCKLATEMQMMIVDEMQPDDRCRFSGASRLSNKEAKLSKNYIHTLRFRVVSPKIVRIIVFYGKHEHVNGRAQLTSWLFKEKSDKTKYLSQNNRFDEQLWEDKLDNTKSIFEHAEEFYENMLISYQRQIKKVIIGRSETEVTVTNLFSNLHKKITNLRSLKELVVDDSMDIIPMFPIIFNTALLQTLDIVGEEANTALKDFKQIYQVDDLIVLNHLKLNNEEFLQLTASYVYIHIGQLTERNIYNFIRSWQDGTIGKSIRYYEWNLENSNFNVDRLFELLEDVDHQALQWSYKLLEIKHHNDRKMLAEIELYESSLRFRVKQRNRRNAVTRFHFFEEG